VRRAVSRTSVRRRLMVALDSQLVHLTYFHIVASASLSSWGRRPAHRPGHRRATAAEAWRPASSKAFCNSPLAPRPGGPDLDLGASAGSGAWSQWRNNALGLVARPQVVVGAFASPARCRRQVIVDLGDRAVRRTRVAAVSSARWQWPGHGRRCCRHRACHAGPANWRA